MQEIRESESKKRALFRGDSFPFPLLQNLLWCTECNRCCLNACSACLLCNVHLSVWFPISSAIIGKIAPSGSAADFSKHHRKVFLDASRCLLLQFSYYARVLCTTFKYGYVASKHFGSVDSAHIQCQTGFLCKNRYELFLKIL